MGHALAFLAAALALSGAALTPGDHARSVHVGTRTRPYSIHVPPSYDPAKPTPVVLALHPFGTNAMVMAAISGLSETADRSGFIVAYPNGTGETRTFLAWNEAQMGDRHADDVGYIARVLDDLEAVVNVDRNRVYATGMSNGAMMCYRLASELSDRIAAIATVAGTMAFEKCQARRPVSVLHFHGTADPIVPFSGPSTRTPFWIRFKSVDETVRLWAQANGCPAASESAELPSKRNNGIRVFRTRFGSGRDGSEVILYKIEGGGHTWPGRDLRARFLGKSALDLSANDLMWEFFQRHPLK